MDSFERGLSWGRDKYEGEPSPPPPPPPLSSPIVSGLVVELLEEDLWNLLSVCLPVGNDRFSVSESPARFFATLPKLC